MARTRVEKADVLGFREQREAAERAVKVLVDALVGSLALAGSPLPGLTVRCVSVTTAGVWVDLGGIGLRDLVELADQITDTRGTGRTIPGEVLPGGLAELPRVRGALNR